MTAIVDKSVEKQMLKYSQPILGPNQSCLEFRFTSGCSSIYAALMLSEVMAESVDLNQELLITF